MFRRLIAAGLAVMAAGFTSAAFAQVNKQDNWVLIGTRNVGVLKEDKDTIDLKGAKGRFKAVRIVGKRRAVDIHKIEIHYSDGKVHNEQRSIRLQPGERTRPIDLRRDERFIDQIVMFYKTEPGTVIPAEVEVYGLQSPAGAAAARPAGAPAASPAIGAATPPPKATAAVGRPTDSGEVLFGAQYVGFGVDRDVIKVGAEVGKFDRVRLRVLDNDIHINSMKIVYSNNESEDVALNADIKKDTRTRWLQLKGDRFIKEIQLVYRSRPNFRGQAFVEVYGEYAEGWLGPQGEGRKFNAGWVLLGAQTAGFTIDRNDVIKIGRNEGGFRKVRVNVRDQAITLFEVRVVYGNGESDVIPANRTRVDAGSAYGPIDLKGGTRVISEIRPTYRTRVFQQGGVAKGRAIVEFWGQH